MNIALRYPARRVAKQGRHGHFRKPEIAAHAGEGMTQRMGRDTAQPCPRRYAVKHLHQPDEMTAASVGGEYPLAVTKIDLTDGCAPDWPKLRATLGIGKAHTPCPRVYPFSA